MRIQIYLTKTIIVLFFLSHGIVSFADLSSPQKWEDQEEHILDETIWRASGYKLVTLAYSTCLSVCPMTAGRLRAIEKIISEKLQRDNNPKIYLVSITPQSDSPSKRKAFLNLKGNPQWTFLKGEVIQVKKLAGDLGLGFANPTVNNDSHIMHTSQLVLLDGKGQIKGRWDILSTHPQEIANDIVRFSLAH